MKNAQGSVAVEELDTGGAVNAIGKQHFEAIAAMANVVYYTAYGWQAEGSAGPPR
ncbi:MAG: hypothetical protein NVS4B6_00660 [Mycobacterium sp.]